MRWNKSGCGLTTIIVGFFVLPVLLIIIGNAAEAPRSIIYVTATPGDIQVASANLNLSDASPVNPTPRFITATPLPTLPPTATLTATPTEIPVTPSATTVLPGIPDTRTQDYGVVELTHLVQPGETLPWISLRYQTPLVDILAANDMNHESRIFAGYRITIPVPVSAFIVPEPLAIADNAVPAPSFSAEGEPPDSLNGIDLTTLINMPDDVQEHIREIYALGQTLGRNPYAFSKVGDCNSESPHYLTRFDAGGYNLGDYEYLETTIDYFAGSYERQGMAVHRGFHSWTVFDPFWAPPTYCLPNESPVDCELRLNNPAIVLVRLGTNDKGVPDSYDANMRQLVEHLLEEGVIPVLGTKADRFEGIDNINNRLLRQIAEDYKIPLWDFDLLAGTLPGRGLGDDGIHMTTFFAHDYTSPVAMQRGHSAQNLSALIVLDEILRVVLPEV